MMTLFFIIAFLTLAYSILKSDGNNSDRLFEQERKESESDFFHGNDDIERQLYNNLKFLLAKHYKEIEKKNVVKLLYDEVEFSAHNYKRLMELSTEIDKLREYSVEELAEYYFDKAEECVKNNNSSYSRKYYNKAIILVQKPIYYNNRGCFYHKLNMLDIAIMDFTQAINLEPNFGMYYYNRGGAYFALLKTNEAHVDWKRASELGMEEARELLKLHFFE